MMLAVMLSPFAIPLRTTLSESEGAQGKLREACRLGSALTREKSERDPSLRSG